MHSVLLRVLARTRSGRCFFRKMHSKPSIHPIVNPCGTHRPYIVAGPCSAESEEQVMQTAALVKDCGVHMFRAGLWKPRTRPDSFEGVGAEGLPWLLKVRATYGLPVMTEVANARHAEDVLKAGLDAVWIGARTTANPFAVQEIAEAFRGTGMTVWVKNPVNPDVELWIGALERLSRAGIRRLGGIHRGFSSFGGSGFRNEPCWQIPIELRRLIPELPILTDPSHIGGRRDMVLPIAQYALNLDSDGLMIEAHCHPDTAQSDAEQQVTPEMLSVICRNLRTRRPQADDAPMETLNMLRKEIDATDSRLIELLAQRMEISERIGMFKRSHNLSILQADRWNELLNEQYRIGHDKGLSDSFIKKIYDAIHVESIERQQRVMNPPDEDRKYGTD